MKDADMIGKTRLKRIENDALQAIKCLTTASNSNAMARRLYDVHFPPERAVVRHLIACNASFSIRFNRVLISVSVRLLAAMRLFICVRSSGD